MREARTARRGVRHGSDAESRSSRPLEGDAQERRDLVAVNKRVGRAVPSHGGDRAPSSFLFRGRIASPAHRRPRLRRTSKAAARRREAPERRPNGPPTGPRTGRLRPLVAGEAFPCRHFQRVSEGTRTPDRLDHNPQIALDGPPPAAVEDLDDAPAIEVGDDRRQFVSGDGARPHRGTVGASGAPRVAPCAHPPRRGGRRATPGSGSCTRRGRSRRARRPSVRALRGAGESAPSRAGGAEARSGPR